MEIWAENWFLWIFPYLESSYFFLVFQKAYFFHNRGGGLLAKIFTLGQNKRWENVTSVMTRTWYEHTTFCTGVRRATVAPRLHVERQVWDVMSVCLCAGHTTTHNYTTTNNYFACGCVYVCVYVFSKLFVFQIRQDIFIFKIFYQPSPAGPMSMLSCLASSVGRASDS